MSSFIAQIRQQIEQIEQRKNLVIRKVALDAFAKVQAKSPVDTGALRRSWTVAPFSLKQKFPISAFIL
ncbi:HK97 gp10 family phage protein [Glaesserella parasuis]|nr:HK97 gp10 family phage protein [Glaesserella parasuis]MDP0461402.1 HK97 gp10 family phage protein [Glaesserella parasuis]